MSSSLSSSSLLLPIHKGPRARQSTRDTNPVLWKPPPTGNDEDDSTSSSSRKANEQEACGVCRCNQARYTCPKCKTPYCSVNCYRNHSNNNNNNNNNADQGTAAAAASSSSSSSCTETFYQNRVSQVLQLEVKEKQQETRQMLNRAHHHEEQTQGAVNDESLLSQEELYNLLQVLEEGDEQELSRLLLSLPTLRHALDQSIAQGELQDWVLEPWYPWWRPQLAGSMSDKEQENSVGEDVEEVCIGEEATSSHVETIDERLLRVPSFETLRPSNKKQLVPQLKYNMLDLLYAVAWTLRLYHGVDNAKEVAIPAAYTMMQSSKVLLSRDAHFESLEEVMTSSTAASSRAYQSNGNECNTSWQVLAQDVALICRSRRQVGRALLEASDVLKAAVSVTKKSGDREGASEMRRIRKKIEFYLSWSQCQSEVSLKALADDVKSWVADWKETTEGEIDDVMILPNS